jgi:Predicted Rossmann fold nucleotide-binding protein involved in DNA uptake
VLGNGLNHHYPPENRTLEDGIAASGALVTEFPLDAVPDRAHFPRRNRIIAALSIATAVIEADVKSGALITASFALEQGKEVFAVPGPVFSRMSSGPHFLIKSGAPCIESAQDIVSALPSLAGRLRPARAKAGGSAPSGTEGGEILAALEDETEGLSIDALGERLALSSGEIAFGLLDLELKGLVRCLPGKIYVLVR